VVNVMAFGGKPYTSMEPAVNEGSELILFPAKVRPRVSSRVLFSVSRGLPARASIGRRV